MARSGRAGRIWRCPLTGVDRKSLADRQTDLIDPERTSAIAGCLQADMLCISALDAPGNLCDPTGGSGEVNMNDLVLPETRYALSGEVNIAYQTMGEAPVDIIMVPGSYHISSICMSCSGYSGFLRRLSTFARVVTFDKEGPGIIRPNFRRAFA